jgi:hypothetical protein
MSLGDLIFGPLFGVIGLTLLFVGLIEAGYL